MKTLLIVETGQGRESMLRAIEDTLAEGEAIVKVTDIVNGDDIRLTVPTHPEAEIVAREPPKLMPGGETHLTSYVRFPSGPYTAVAFHLVDGEEVSQDEVELDPERLGSPERERAGAAAS